MRSVTANKWMRRSTVRVARAAPNRLQLLTRPRATKRTVLRTFGITMLCLGAAACSWFGGGSDPEVVNPTPPPREPATVAATAPPAANRAADTALAKWTRSCSLCHVNGEGGAPRVGVAAEWQPRLAQGRAALLQHTIEGFNNMPPLGYCMSCERDDFEAIIDFMAGDAP